MRPGVAFSIFSGVILFAGAVYAHKVGADAYVVDDGKTIQVEAWLSGGKVPKKGTVLVLGEDETEIAKGDLEEGVFRFNPGTAQRFFFVVNLGEGHVRKFALEDKQLAKLRLDEGLDPAGSQSSLEGGTSMPPASPIVRRATEETHTLERAILGVALIILGTAVAMMIQMNKRLRRIERTLENEKGKDSGNSSS